jgi:hypothetical protein
VAPLAVLVACCVHSILTIYLAVRAHNQLPIHTSEAKAVCGVCRHTVARPCGADTMPCATPAPNTSPLSFPLPHREHCVNQKDKLHAAVSCCYSGMGPQHAAGLRWLLCVGCANRGLCPAGMCLGAHGRPSAWPPRCCLNTQKHWSCPPGGSPKARMPGHVCSSAAHTLPLPRSQGFELGTLQCRQAVTVGALSAQHWLAQ